MEDPFNSDSINSVSIIYSDSSNSDCSNSDSSKSDSCIFESNSDWAVPSEHITSRHVPYLLTWIYTGHNGGIRSEEVMWGRKEKGRAGSSVHEYFHLDQAGVSVARQPEGNSSILVTSSRKHNNI